MQGGGQPAHAHSITESPREKVARGHPPDRAKPVFHLFRKNHEKIGPLRAAFRVWLRAAQTQTDPVRFGPEEAKKFKLPNGRP